MIKLKNKTVLVCGGGKSGRAMAKFLLSKGSNVIVSDTKKIRIPGAECILQDDISRRLGEINMMILSPGIDPKNSFVREAKRRKIPVAGEFEFAYSFVPSYVKRILVTGTNGKSTVTSLIAAVLSSAGKNAIAGGNIGIPVTELLKKFKKNSILVAEVSSYNLEKHLSRKAFGADVSILLNIDSDHLSRYRNMAEYGAVKKSIFAGIRRGGVGISGIAGSPGSDILRLGKDIYFRGNTMRFSPKAAKKFRASQELIYEKEKMKLLFDANKTNILAAAGAAMAMGVSSEKIRRGVYRFRPLANRLEYSGTHRGRIFINDSKATNVSSVLFALKNINRPLILIMGGRDKGSSYNPLSGHMQNVKTLVVYGEAGAKIAKELNGKTEITAAEKFADACLKALKKSSPGDTVLLSPGCSSFDQFKDFEERGKAFKKWIKNLT
ncbi:MAG: UDP-N-acetylmuramoyl-L-alanine--D-glutamate ligase [Candidatus Omnitrophota bacterium]|nr:UDP-N-acetylmuramoyl-L-alanine--D-glutamate ligase [bacterium]MBU3929388.1 UDP-N-acetylmuramoyl-L-alanine--D-glutamate ligase [bacterium]MBU4057871.1 UDP-N-acetylmuramoyl-L-alanine--D-glutamate ligase [Patescibacteria group bacterium]